MLIDSHCHLNYLDDAQAALQRARQAGVSGCLCIGVDRAGIDAVISLADSNQDVWASVGEHPASSSGDASWVADYLPASKVVALGEMGLDYLHSAGDQSRAVQRHTFSQQLALAAQHQYPVIVHTRGAQQDTIAMLAAYPEVTGVLHCFTESWEMAEQALDMGYYISISGIVTFKNADNVREVAQQVPLERLLVETDAPWLAPTPHRGKPNEPAYVVHTADYLAQLRGLPTAQLVEHTVANFHQLFRRTVAAGVFTDAG